MSDDRIVIQVIPWIIGAITAPTIPQNKIIAATILAVGRSIRARAAKPTPYAKGRDRHPSKPPMASINDGC
jgi:hypothetical protein